MQNILITGTNRGIGLALSARFLELGHRVFAGARDLGKTGALRELPEADRARLDVIELDVGSDESVNRAAREVGKLTPRLDVLVNMAGISPAPHDARLDTVNLDTFRRAFEINVVGPLRVAQAFAPLLRAAATPEAPARLVNVSSGVASMKGKDNGIFYAYGVSKTALNMLSVTEAFDLREANVAVISLDPGWVRTDLGGPNAWLAPEESARPCADLILGLSLEQSGKFLHYSGSEIAF